MSKYNSKCPLNCNKRGCGTNLCQRYSDYQQGKADGASEFAEWLFKSKYREINMDGFSWYDDKGIDRLESLDKVLSEWQKEVNNAE